MRFSKAPASLLALAAFFFALSCNQDGLPGGNDIEPDLKSTTGWSGEEDAAHIQDDISLLGGGNLPASVDLSQYLPPIGDQGQIPSCIAWSSGYYQKTGMNARDGGLSFSQLQDPAFQTSARDLYDAIPNDLKGGGCEGTHFQHAYDVQIARGVADAATAPLGAWFDCESGPDPAWAQKAAGNKIVSYREVPLEAEKIKEKLAAGHFVSFGATVRPGFSAYRGGLIDASVNSGSGGGGHAMLLVGYDDGLGAFKIVNSWGTDWGENGFGWVPYGYFCGGQFAKYCFVAYNSANVVQDPTNPPNYQTQTELFAAVYSDVHNPNSWDGRDRRVVFDVLNVGAAGVPASARWDVCYLYFNAFNMNDYGVVDHYRITDEFGGNFGPYLAGLGASANWWYNRNLPAQSSLGQAMFGFPSSIQQDYAMPPITGQYYLVLMADAFSAVAEHEERDNFWYVTNPFGGPLTFVNGVGLVGDETDDRATTEAAPEIDHRTPVNAANWNAYRPEELRAFIRALHQSGKLKRAVEHFDVTNAPRPR